jgi:hypothetical protein
MTTIARYVLLCVCVSLVGAAAEENEFGMYLYELDELIIQAHSNTTSMVQISIYVEIGKISLTFVTESFS